MSRKERAFQAPPRAATKSRRLADLPAALRARGADEAALVAAIVGLDGPCWHSAMTQADWEVEAGLVEREREERARFAAGLCPQVRAIYLEGFEKPCLVERGRTRGSAPTHVEGSVAPIDHALDARGRKTELRGPLWMVPEIVKDELALASIEVEEVLDISSSLWTEATWQRHRAACDRLERATSAIREAAGRAYQVPHQGRKLSPAERKRVVEMRRDGLKFREIAEVLQRPIGTIQSVLRRVG